jgi:aminotransferase
MIDPNLLSQRIRQLPFSGIRKVFEEARRQEQEGICITHMEIGRPDFDTPPHIKAAAVQALNAGQVHYSSNLGIPELRQAIAEKWPKRTAYKWTLRVESLLPLGVRKPYWTPFQPTCAGGMR